MSSTYAPSSVPVGEGSFPGWLANELRRIAAELNNPQPKLITLDVLGVEPEKRQDGMIVYADGVAWNPGSGAGFYGRQSGVWVKL